MHGKQQWQMVPSKCIKKNKISKPVVTSLISGQSWPNVLICIDKEIEFEKGHRCFQIGALHPLRPICVCLNSLTTQSCSDVQTARYIASRHLVIQWCFTSSQDLKVSIWVSLREAWKWQTLQQNIQRTYFRLGNFIFFRISANPHLEAE